MSTPNNHRSIAHAPISKADDKRRHALRRRMRENRPNTCDVCGDIVQMPGALRCGEDGQDCDNSPRRARGGLFDEVED